MTVHALRPVECVADEVLKDFSRMLDGLYGEARLQRKRIEEEWGWM